MDQRSVFLQIIVLAALIVCAACTPEFRKTKMMCQAVDAYMQEGTRPVKGSFKLTGIQGGRYWNLQNIGRAPLSISLQYTSQSKEPQIITAEIAGETITTNIGYTGLNDRKNPVKKIVLLGSVIIKDPGNHRLEIKSPGNGDAIISGVILEGAGLARATVDAYQVSTAREIIIEPVKDAGIEHNTLSDEECAQGWELLFNGKDLSGWVTFQAEERSPFWVVGEGNTLHGLQNRKERRKRDLISSREFEDYEFKLEWKIGLNGNSGIFMRCNEEKLRPWENAIEMQVADHTTYKDRWTTAGACYALYAPETSPANPVGEWNKVHCIIRGAHHQFFLNGTKTADFVVGSPEWQRKVAKSKFWVYPGFGENVQGRIGLQDHGSEVWYRNIKVRELK